jgi:hypothetical protein
MKESWVVIWKGKTLVTYKTEDDWSLDPLEAKSFSTWVGARFAARGIRGAIVTKCWMEG